MEDFFITGIQIDKYRSIEKLDIQLSQDTRQHLIITGKNGSGKTSLLSLLIKNAERKHEDEKESIVFEPTTDLLIKNEEDLFNYKKVGTVSFNKGADIKEVLMMIFPAEHLFHVSMVSELANLQERNRSETVCRPSRFVYQNILQTMVTMRIQQLEAKENKDAQLYEQSEKWFSVLNRVLNTIYENQTIEIKFIPIDYNYKLILDGNEFDLNQMADGFSAFFRIVSEIMEKMDYNTGYGCDYSLPGIAFIDELETHMHISMQKIALGFLTEMFPNVQFIVTTHSPFIINSLENAIVYDLSRKESLENSHLYSYETIIEGYYDINMYSSKMQEMFERYRELAFSERTDEEKIEFAKLRVELETVSPAQKELFIAFRDVENKRKMKANG